MGDQMIPKIGVGCWVLCDDQVLLLRRQGAHGAGTWGLTGGRLDFGEDWFACAKRETLEETGVEVNDVTFLGLTNDVFEREHYVTLFVAGEAAHQNAKLMEPDKCTEVRWFPLDQLPDNLFAPLAQFVEAYGVPTPKKLNAQQFQLLSNPQLYQHYKGVMYYKMGEALHTENRQSLAIYTNDDGMLFARPKAMFEETVEVNGQAHPRFTKVEAQS